MLQWPNVLLQKKKKKKKIPYGPKSLLIRKKSIFCFDAEGWDLFIVRSIPSLDSVPTERWMVMFNVGLRSQMIHLCKMPLILLWHVLSCCGSCSPSFLSLTPDLFGSCETRARLSFSFSSSSVWVEFCQKKMTSHSWRAALKIYCHIVPSSFFILSFCSFIFCFSLPFITRKHWCVSVFYSLRDAVCVIGVIGSHRIMHIAHTEKENTDTNMHARGCS